VLNRDDARVMALAAKPAKDGTAGESPAPVITFGVT